MSNHESFVDILLISHLPFEMKWLSKAEMFKIPVVGWLMTLAGDIRLTRGEISSATDAMKQCADRLERRCSVMIFPEGTRSPTGELGKFKNGAFRLAIDTGVPILPVAVHGTRSALRTEGLALRLQHRRGPRARADRVSGLTHKDIYALRDQVRTGDRHRDRGVARRARRLTRAAAVASRSPCRLQRVWTNVPSESGRGLERMALLDVQEVSVRFGGIIALDGLSFTIDEGQICGLIGPNGAGKTTMFNVVSRIYHATEGRCCSRATTC